MPCLVRAENGTHSPQFAPIWIPKQTAVTVLMLRPSVVRNEQIYSKFDATELSVVPSAIPNNVIVVPTSTTPFDGKERQQVRNGFSLLILPNVNRSPTELSLLARQQILWAAKMTHFVCAGPALLGT
mmetsp:Transcript_27838/g.32106  ORF Transcript_27838/g.32106 Transcript_27838/m.32106 type:complete len:127 (+) Transcript_27838:172-552(+)